MVMGPTSADRMAGLLDKDSAIAAPGVHHWALRLLAIGGELAREGKGSSGEDSFVCHFAGNVSRSKKWNLGGCCLQFV